MIRAVVCTLALYTVAVTQGPCQRIPAPLISPTATSDREALVGRQAGQAVPRRGSMGRAIGFGILLGAAGFVGGALIGDATSNECDGAQDICIPQAAFFGAAGGGTLGLTTGVHLGYRRRGNFLLDLLAAAAVWGTGIAIAAGSDDEHLRAAVLVAIPVAQLGAAVLVERASAGP